jgi:dienelactone hydrolase
VAEVLLFHHALGLTPGVLAFAAELHLAGHTVHTPDLFEGRTFGSIDEGIAHVEEVGFDAIGERGVAAAEGLSNELVYVGFSLGVMSAQKLAQTRAGAKGAVLFYSFVPPKFFGEWPSRVPAQIHMHESDPFVVEEGDLEAAREVAESVEGVDLFLYPGDTHYFADSTHEHYDEQAAKIAKERVLAFLESVG